jgi:NTP pyrophosphatase (non-canonical NTP hydrolase)
LPALFHFLRRAGGRSRLTGWLAASAGDNAHSTALPPVPRSSSMTIGHDRLEHLRARLAAFVAERDWDQFHNPKNLAMALSVEAGELVEHFMWLSPAEADRLPPDSLAEVELEMADILLFLLRLSDRLGVDLVAAAEKKLALNAAKYPVEKSKGRSTKYDKL